MRRGVTNTTTAMLLEDKDYEHFDIVTIQGKVHPCTGNEALYRPYGP
jgi:hypothetical protein